MSNVRDRGVIDITLEEDGRYVLVILDDMKWEPATRQEHGHILQAKINDYLDYIVSGQAEEAKPGLRPVIRIIAQYSYSKYCIDFLERVRAFIKGKDDICDIEWTHSSEDGPFEDGFSDDFVFDETKIYPRIKKNWAKDPQNQVSLMPPDASIYEDLYDSEGERIQRTIISPDGSTVLAERCETVEDGNKKTVISSRRSIPLKVM